jgi:hypothetical protein
MDDSKPIFTRPSETALQEFQKGGGNRASGRERPELALNLILIGKIGWGNASSGRYADTFLLRQRDENDDFPTVACDLR